MAAAGLSDRERSEVIEADPALTPLLRDYLDAASIANEMTDLKDAIRDKLKLALGDRQAVSCDAGRVYFREQISQRIDTTALKAGHPDIAKAYTKPVASRPLRVYPTEGRRND
jgi:predicted phage-related endonuclease